jgi:uncharacterized protein (DUF58 family)
MRLIHWPTTARTGEYFIRILESTPASDWWIFLDLDRRSLAGTGALTTEEHGVILAASLIEHGLRGGQAVGLVTQAGGLAWHPPRIGEAHRQEMMRTLALAASGPIRLSALLQQGRRYFRRGPSLVVITAGTDPEWLPDLSTMAHGSATPQIFLLDPDTYPNPGPSSGTARGLADRLAALGLEPNVLGADFFDRPEIRPGTQGRWAWRRAQSSRAVADQRPSDLPWQRL